MPARKTYSFILIALGCLLIVGVAIFLTTRTADAQCGSQASSCKNCHEVQGQKPVNNDGTGWHQSHAFGDFCYICHAGNNQSMDKNIAHTGMVPPLSDTKAACQSCHPNDLDARVKVYADKLGVKPGGGSGSTGTTTGGGAPSAGNPSSGGTSSGGSTTAGTGSTGASSSSTNSGAAAMSAAPGMVVENAEVIDYNKIYSGQANVNWGNIILVVLIVIVAVGGGTFVFFNERKLAGKSVRPKAKPAEPATDIPMVEGYTPEITSLLPAIAKLDPVGLHALKKLLENPENASELLHSLSRLDPELVRRIRGLDRDSRTLLLALSSD